MRMAPDFFEGTEMNEYEMHRRKAERMRARVMKAWLRMARGAVAKAAHAARVRFYEAAGVKIRAIRGRSPISLERT